MKKTAVFIDTMSIQKYIFSSNSLKENIGASFLVKQLFEKLKNQFEYSYIGGGNALLYFENETEAKEEMKKWSKEALIKYPGITPVIVIENEFDIGTFAESRTQIIQKLLKQRNEFIPITTLNSFGFTTECPRTGLSSEIYLNKNITQEDFNYVSSQSYAKIQASEKANVELENKFRTSSDGKEFPDQLDKLGGSKGENNHIAIVHIDGNDMGDKFKGMTTEKELKDFSQGLEKATENSFKEMLEKGINDFDEISRELNIEENCLPLRPIIIGGDDITFVCDSRLALYLSYHFIKAFENQKICRENKLTACAGISIVKTKYPFYRAYKLAEELCSNAKKERKNNTIYNDTDSLIDFHISFGGLGNNLAEIRENNYISSDGERLYKKPYSLKEIPTFLNCLNELIKLPQGKVEKLREVLHEGKTATEKFIKELKFRGKELPKFSNIDETETGFTESITPYLDMIEMIDFCPEFFREQEVNNE